MSGLRALAHRETASAPDAAQHPASSAGPRPVRIGSASPPLRVGVLVERRYLSQAQPSGLVAALRARGCRVRVIDPEASAVRVGDDRWRKGLDLIVARWPGRGALAQELVAGDGRERKLYGIGDQVWAVERAAPLVAGRASARRPAVAAGAEGPVATPAELALAAACRRIFGLDLYGIDCIP